jgi:hypothetical protein
MKSRCRRWGLVVLALCLAAGWGCGRGAPKLYPVSGVVMNGPEPVARASVSFSAVPTPGVQPLDGYASTDNEGRFTVQTVSQGKGVPAGSYKVVITREQPARGQIPVKFTSLSTTTLRVDVPEGGAENLKLNLNQ